MRTSEIMEAAKLADLAASGLDKPPILRKLKITKALGEEATRDITGLEQCLSYEIPYFDVAGKLINYSRWKIIPFGDDAPPMKYFQQDKTIPHVYIPPLLDWRKIANDPSKRIVLTEGEKKAACACSMNMPTIGLGGVWNWKSRKWSMETLSDFDQFVWAGREVEICYDGDLYSNENVARALGALCSTMAKFNARVFIRRLPNTSGKTGLDDFLMEFGKDEYFELPCEEAEETKELHSLNEQIVYVKDMVAYYSVDERVFYRTPAMLAQRYGHLKITGHDGKVASAVKIWTEWPHRSMVDSLTYAPGKPKLFDGKYNEWRPGPSPKRGKVSPVLELIEGLGDARFREWFIKWLAYPLQKPGTKLLSAVMLWGGQGTGKTFLGEIMCGVYGEGNSVVISDVDLHDERYAWLRGRQFVLAEEVTQGGRRQDASLIKHLITGTTIRVNEKYVPAYTLPNMANFMFTSNAPDAIRLERDDRRFAVVEVSQRRPQKFWDEMDRWWRKEGGAEHWLYYLLNNVKLGRFNPRGPAPFTDDKEQMIHTSMSAVEQWAHMLVQNPDDVLPSEVAKAAPGKDVFTTMDLFAILPDEIRDNCTPTSLSRALARAGVVRAGVMRTERGAKRLVAIRNLDYWREKLNDVPAWSANYVGKMTVQRRSRKR